MATILVTEDDSDLLILFRERLECHGYTVLVASDGVDALKILRQEQDGVDLVLTGVHMPRMNGLELGNN